ncbi:MAG: xanthine dehydrogenase family protein subunit M [Chloroflexi bacterium]|nr:xanthine dehydrogenase family protein subunit M [Chloroflexota bacterium]
MKPPRFEYVAPRTLDEALAFLARSPDETKLIAGGQSLVPLLNLRLIRPKYVVDLNTVEGLSEIRRPAEGALRLGAMVRQRALENHPLVRQLAPLLPEAARYVAHAAIRNRGTVGGSLAHADPAAELPAAMTVLRARLTLNRADGATRSLSPEEFFLGPLTTAIRPDEILTAIEIEPPPENTGWAFLEVARVHGAFALVGVAALVHLDRNGIVDLARIALCGVDGVPYAPEWFEEMIVGQRPGSDLFSQVGRRLRETLQPVSDPVIGAEYRRTAASSLVVRALDTAHRRAS